MSVADQEELMVERPIRNGRFTSRARFFSTLSEAYQSLKRHKTGASGGGLGKELGNKISARRFFLNYVGMGYSDCDQSKAIFAIILAMPWIDYDPNVHGVIHQHEWRFHDRLGEAEIRAVEHVQTKILFCPRCRIGEHFDLHFATTYEGEIPPGFDIKQRAQEAMRYFSLHLKTTPEMEEERAEEWRVNVIKHPS
jgi:hypothetical protein